jgi:hypothetical protein
MIQGYAVGFAFRPTHYTHHSPFLQPSIHSYFEYSYKHICLRNRISENYEENSNQDLSSSSSAFYADSDCLDLCDTGEFQDQNLDTRETRRESDESSYSTESVTRSTTMRESSHTFTEDEKTNMSPKQMMKNIEFQTIKNKLSNFKRGFMIKLLCENQINMSIGSITMNSAFPSE